MEGVTYYRIVSRRIRFREYWRIVNGNLLHFAIAGVCKLLGVPLDFGAVARQERLALVGEDDVDPFATVLWRPLVEACRGLGFRPAIAYRGATLGPSRGFGTAMTGPDRRILASIIASRAEQNGIVTEEVQLVFFSRRLDGPFVVTTNGRQRFDASAEAEAVYQPGATAEALWDTHRRRLSEPSNARLAEWQEADVEPVVLAVENLTVDIGLRRGIYAAMSVTEIIAMKKRYGL